MKYQGLCPCCEQGNCQLERLEIEETVKVHNEAITVTSKFIKCLDCGEVFDDLDSFNSVDLAYREYRRRHNWLQPEEITERRKRLKIYPETLAGLLGCDVKTLTRYELGALQTPEHELALRRVLGP